MKRSLFHSRCVKSFLLGFACLLYGAQNVSAELLLSFQQSGSNVVATLSGTVDAAWGTPLVQSGAAVQASGYGGWGGFGAEFRYGSSPTGYDLYIEGSVDFYPSVSLSGTTFDGGVVEAGATPDMAWIGLDPDNGNALLWVSPNATSVSGSITWSGKSLSDFFASGTPVSSDFYNSSFAKLGTLQVGIVPEPSTTCMVLAGLGFTGYAGFRRRKRV